MAELEIRLVYLAKGKINVKDHGLINCKNYVIFSVISVASFIAKKKFPIVNELKKSDHNFLDLKFNQIAINKIKYQKIQSYKYLVDFRILKNFADFIKKKSNLQYCYDI
ncbi:hypothetical protein BpHYR1_023106, partial [Brachionus plicatilis]